MAADKTPEQEPSIEEILASIRQIISDDEEKDSIADAPAKAPEPQPVFEPASFAPEPEPEPEDEPEEIEDDILELTDPLVEEVDEPVAETMEEIQIDLQESEPPPPPPPPPAREEIKMPVLKAEPEGDDFLTAAAKNAAISSMAKLAGNMPVTRHRDHGNITLEDLVREMLNPLLRDWLSDNLPPMVERIVQKELEKLARQAQDV